MLDNLSLAWRLLDAFPMQRYLQLLPWHFTAVLIVLGFLSAFGLHHIVGYTFRFYSPDGRHRRILAAVTLVVLMASVLSLLLAYLLRTQSENMIKASLTPENAVDVRDIPGGNARHYGNSGIRRILQQRCDSGSSVGRRILWKNPVGRGGNRGRLYILLYVPAPDSGVFRLPAIHPR